MIKRFWEWLFQADRDRRKGDRTPTRKVSAYYWNGARAEKCEVRDISPSGLYVVTEDRWYPGPVVRMTVQEDGVDGAAAEHHISIDSKTMRYGEDGMGMSFVTGSHEGSTTSSGLINEVRDRNGVEQFIRRLLKRSGSDALRNTDFLK